MTQGTERSIDAEALARNPAQDREAAEPLYKVVINIEEQYSIWMVDRSTPAGWREVGMVGKKADCLSYIDRHWTDMRPLSLRRSMETER